MSDDRRCVIAKIRRDHLMDLLAGDLQCVNWPEMGHIEAMVVDIASDSVMVRLRSPQFPVVPQFERFPDFELRMNVLVSADTIHAKVN